VSWAVVIPTNRPDRLTRFLDAWGPLFDRHNVQVSVVVDDQATWDKMPSFIPRRSDMIRSLGFLRVFHREDIDYVLTLDDDTLPIATLNGRDIFEQYQRVFEAGAPLSDYLDVGALTTSGLQMRGFPYGDRKPATVAIQYGGWHGVLDYDARTQLAHPRGPERFSETVLPVPRGTAVTGCIMNCAFRREVTPIMWQLPLLEGRYNRWGDIWSGLIQKRVLDRIGQVMVINGKASVLHQRASDPNVNLERETPGIPFNENMWRWIKPDHDATGMVAAWMRATDLMAMRFEESDPKYAHLFRESRDAWITALAEVPAHV
jgi:hypothetical protein